MLKKVCKYYSIQDHGQTIDDITKFSKKKQNATKSSIIMLIFVQ